MVKKYKVESNVVIENARIIFRNFSGKEGRYNPAGQRNFALLLEPDIAETLKKDGWNVKYLKPREEGDPEQAYMKVNVAYGGPRDPEIILIAESGKRHLYEETVSMLDWADVKTIDMIISPYNWEVAGKSGVAAYLRKMYITIIEDELASKYNIAPGDVEDDAPPWVN